jgi:hypothetical protein
MHHVEIAIGSCRDGTPALMRLKIRTQTVGCKFNRIAASDIVGIRSFNIADCEVRTMPHSRFSWVFDRVSRIKASSVTDFGARRPPPKP